MDENQINRYRELGRTFRELVREVTLEDQDRLPHIKHPTKRKSLKQLTWESQFRVDICPRTREGSYGTSSQFNAGSDQIIVGIHGTINPNGNFFPVQINPDEEHGAIKCKSGLPCAPKMYSLDHFLRTGSLSPSQANTFQYDQLFAPLLDGNKRQFVGGLLGRVNDYVGQLKERLLMPNEDSRSLYHDLLQSTGCVSSSKLSGWRENTMLLENLFKVAGLRGTDIPAIDEYKFSRDQIVSAMRATGITVNPDTFFGAAKLNFNLFMPHRANDSSGYAFKRDGDHFKLVHKSYDDGLA